MQFLMLLDLNYWKMGLS